MKTITIKNVTIEYEYLELKEYLTSDNFTHIQIGNVTINGTDLRRLIIPRSQSVVFQFEPTTPDNADVVLPNEYESIFRSIFSVVSELYRLDKGCLAGALATFLFDSVTPLWRNLIDQGKHILAIQLWRKVLSLAYEWEQTTGKHIHKGSPYAFIARTYLIVGDISTGFSYIYNAIEEDRKLNDVCPQIKYPNNAPVYLTATLVPDSRNFMFPLVSAIRSALEGYLGIYRREFGSKLSMEEFDERFLHNADFEPINYYFVLTFWMIFEHQCKVGHDLMQNDFSKLKNADWLFSLCLVLNRLLDEHCDYKDTSGHLGPEIIQYVTKKGLMTQRDFEDLRKRVKFKQASPDQIIPKLLSLSLQYNSVRVSREVQYLLVAWKLRNFAGHNIQIQDVITSNFEDIVKVLLCDIFLIVEEY